jgi:hypothetical protein
MRIRSLGSRRAAERRPRGAGHSRPCRRAGAVLALGIFLAACQPDRPLEELARDDDPPAVPAASGVVDGPTPVAQVTLAPVGESRVAGQAEIVGWQTGTRIELSVWQAPPDSIFAAYVGAGSCVEPGPVVTVLEPLRIDGDGTARIRSDHEIAPHEILDGQHFLQVYRGDVQRRIPLACGDLPPRPDLDPGIAPLQ